MIRQAVFALLLGLSQGLSALSQEPSLGTSTARPPAEIPFSRLTADATLAIRLEPGAVASHDAVWTMGRAAGTVVRIDAKDNAVSAPIAAGAQPCASLVVAFDSVWVPLCGDRTIARVDPKERKVTATLGTAVAFADGGIATSTGSVWVITDRKGVLSRLDPDTNSPVAEIYLTGGAASVASGADALWITSGLGPGVGSGESGVGSREPGTESREPGTAGGAAIARDKWRLTRVNPHNNEVVESIAVGPQPGRLAVGEGGVWTLNGDGTVTRVDPKTNKVVATITIGQDMAGGEIAAGAGSVWVSATRTPIVRIDPRTNRAVQRFTGAGGGAILVGHGSLWVAAGTETWRLDPALVSGMRP